MNAQLVNYAERALWTAVQTFVGLLAVDSLMEGQLDSVLVAGSSALSAGLSVLKEYAKMRLRRLRQESRDG